MSDNPIARLHDLCDRIREFACREGAKGQGPLHHRWWSEMHEILDDLKVELEGPNHMGEPVTVNRRSPTGGQEAEDAARLVWAMGNMGYRVPHAEFAMHVLKVGGVGDLSDCRTFIDAAMKESGK